MKAGFGKPGSVLPSVLDALPTAMRAEGLLLLLEMGIARRDVARIAGCPVCDLDFHTRPRVPFRHATEYQPAGAD